MGNTNTEFDNVAVRNILVASDSVKSLWMDNRFSMDKLSMAERVADLDGLSFSYRLLDGSRLATLTIHTRDGRLAEVSLSFQPKSKTSTEGPEAVEAGMTAVRTIVDSITKLLA